MTNIAIENGPVEIVDFHVKNGNFPVRYVKLPEERSFQSTDPFNLSFAIGLGENRKLTFKHPSHMLQVYYVPNMHPEKWPNMRETLPFIEHIGLFPWGPVGKYMFP